MTIQNNNYEQMIGECDLIKADIRKNIPGYIQTYGDKYIAAIYIENRALIIDSDDNEIELAKRMERRERSINEFKGKFTLISNLQGILDDTPDHIEGVLA